MKRDDLIKALRTRQGKVKVAWRLKEGLHIAPNVEKSSMIEEIQAAFPANEETNLYINDNGYLSRESDRV